MKLLYSQTTQQTYPYPRNDDQPIIGLDPDFLVLNRIETTPPTYDPESEIITSNWVVDVDSLEYRQEWVVSQKPVPEPVPNWDGFNFTLFTDPAFIASGLGAQGANPYLVPALVERYAQIAKLGLQESGFGNYFNAFCDSLQVTPEHRGAWADLAEGFNLPTDFVSLIRG